MDRVVVIRTVVVLEESRTVSFHVVDSTGIINEEFIRWRINPGNWLHDFNRIHANF